MFHCKRGGIYGYCDAVSEQAERRLVCEDVNVIFNFQTRGGMRQVDSAVVSSRPAFRKT